MDTIITFKIEDIVHLTLPACNTDKVCDALEEFEAGLEKELEVGEFEDIIANWLCARGWTVTEP